MREDHEDLKPTSSNLKAAMERATVALKEDVATMADSPVYELTASDLGVSTYERLSHIRNNIRDNLAILESIRSRAVAEYDLYSMQFLALERTLKDFNLYRRETSE